MSEDIDNSTNKAHDVSLPSKSHMGPRDTVGIAAMFLGVFTVGVDSFIISPC